MLAGRRCSTEKAQYEGSVKVFKDSMDFKVVKERGCRG